MLSFVLAYLPSLVCARLSLSFVLAYLSFARYLYMPIPRHPKTSTSKSLAFEMEWWRLGVRGPALPEPE
jgi:hypothetical protein